MLWTALNTDEGMGGFNIEEEGSWSNQEGIKILADGMGLAKCLMERAFVVLRAVKQKVSCLLQETYFLGCSVHSGLSLELAGPLSGTTFTCDAHLRS